LFVDEWATDLFGDLGPLHFGDGHFGQIERVVG
jgi:hypothetical protein